MTAFASRSFGKTAARLALLAAVAVTLPACNAAQRMADIGRAPELTKIQDPHTVPGYQPVSLPMPTPLPAERNPNSLWRTGSKAFFKDQRAARVGDLLTVLITINDQAQLNNQTSRTRKNSEDADLGGLFGITTAINGESALDRVFSGTGTGANLANATSDSSSAGTGQVRRQEQINLRLAALISQILPNGNLVVQGRQEVRVNFEVRDLIVTGVVRPEDITHQNTIKYDQIAEARISYGGRGQITDVQQPRYGQQLFDVIMPW